MSDETPATTEPCEQCEGTGWKPHPWRQGYVWCDCPRGALMRGARQARRQTSASKWTRVGERPRGTK